MLAAFTGDAFQTLNIYYLMTFPLTTLASLFVLRQFRISYVTALGASLLFAFLPYHAFRSEYHIFLSAYYHVPLVIMMCLWIFLDDPSPFFWKGEDGVNHFSVWNWRTACSVVICIITASGGIYYAFFGCALLLAVGATSALYRRRLYPCVAATVLIATICLGILGNIAPTIAYTRQHGKNEESVHRGEGCRNIRT